MQPKAKNICKKILHNPFFIALMLTVLAMIIIVAVFKNSNYGGASNIFKSGFYMFIAFSLILLLNNIFLKRTMESTQIKTEVKEVFTGIDMSKEMSHDIIQIEPNLYEENYSIYKEKKIIGGDTFNIGNNTYNSNESEKKHNDNVFDTENTNATENTTATENVSENTNATENVSENTTAPENVSETAPTDVNSILDSIVKIET